MDPATMAMLASAAASLGGGYLAGRGSGKETKMQRTQRHLVDQLIESLSGSGPYANLFATDESAFQKSFVDPAKAMFQNQIAPQIQQQYLASGQQRGSGLEDQLLRAGVDLDQMLNTNYLQFQNQGKDRMSQMLNSILGMGAGGTQAMSPQQSLMQSAAGFLGSDTFQQGLTNYFNPSHPPPAQTPQPMPKGYSA